MCESLSLCNYFSYTLLCVTLQYVMPLIIITLVYTKIYNFLQVRIIISSLT